MFVSNDGRPGQPTSAHTGASGPNLDRDGFFGADERVRGRHTRARGPVNQRQVNSGGIASALRLGNQGHAHEDQARQRSSNDEGPY